MPTLKTLVNFNGANGQVPEGQIPEANLLVDAAGDLFGTTGGGGTNGDGTVFEIRYVDGSYASTPATLFSFNGSDGAFPEAGLIADATGDLFGTTFEGGAHDAGTVFEITYADGGYASTPTTLVSFNDVNEIFSEASLIADAAGDLFGAIEFPDPNGGRTVFEIP